MKRLLKMTWRIFLGVLALFALAVLYAVLLEPSVRCWWYRHELLSALDEASSVRVVEHSSQFDSISSLNDPKYKDATYATVNLTQAQIAALRQALPLTKDYSGWLEKKCMFEEHHSIAVTRRDGSVLTLHICFHCGQMELGDHYGNMPEGWEASLRKFVASLGLHPDGPWDKNPDAMK